MTRCDCGCGASTDAPDANRWWLVETAFGFQVIVWRDKLADDLQHAAGSECVHKLLSQWMEQQREK